MYQHITQNGLKCILISMMDERVLETITAYLGV